MKSHGDKKKEALVLLIGNINHEGVSSAIRTAGRQYKQKMLESKPNNWSEIVRIFDDFHVESVLIKFSGNNFSRILRDEYRDVGIELLAKVGSVPNVVFVYENIITGKYTEEDEDFWTPDEDERVTVLSMFEEHGITVLPYKKNAEVTVIATSFLKETEQNLIFRLYIPTARMWADETDRLLQMFRDYLGRVDGLSVRLDQCRTENGVIYEFFGESSKDETDLATEFADFTQLLDMCASNQAAAEAILVEKNVSPREIIDILSRYGKEAKRLQVDLKHDRERKMLGIRQRLESELVDILPADLNWLSVDALVDSVVPSISGTSAALLIDQSPLRLATHQKPVPVTINLNYQAIEAVNGVVAQEIRGDQHLTTNDLELLKLVQEYGGSNKSELASAVHELADKSAPSTGRLVARQKLKKFVAGLGSKAGDIAAGLLQKYIETQLGM